MHLISNEQTNFVSGGNFMVEADWWEINQWEKNSIGGMGNEGEFWIGAAISAGIAVAGAIAGALITSNNDSKTTTTVDTYTCTDGKCTITGKTVTTVVSEG